MKPPARGALRAPRAGSPAFVSVFVFVLIYVQFEFKSGLLISQKYRDAVNGRTGEAAVSAVASENLGVKVLRTAMKNRKSGIIRTTSTLADSKKIFGASPRKFFSRNFFSGSVVAPFLGKSFG